MKNMIKKLLGKNTAETKKINAEDLIREAALKKVLDYAGYDKDDIKVISTEMTGDTLGSWYVISFQAVNENLSRCEMVFTAYVDIYTGEVCGFLGQAEKTWLDYPARVDTDNNCTVETQFTAKAA